MSLREMLRSSRLLRPVEDLQAGGWSGARRMGAVGGTACPAYASSLLSVVFCSCFDLLCVCICYLLCICLKAGLG